MSVLSDDETVALFQNFLDGRGPAGATREELDQVYEWAAQARLDAAVLALVLRHEVTLLLIDGEFRYVLTDLLKRETVGPQGSLT